MSLAYKVEELLALRDSVSESAVSIDKFADEDVIKEHVLRPSASANGIGTVAPEKPARLSTTPVASAATATLKKPSPSPSIKRGKAERLLKEHGSPPGMRVTAGGRVVPSDLPPLNGARFGNSSFKPQALRSVDPGNAMSAQTLSDVNNANLAGQVQVIGTQAVIRVGDRMFALPAIDTGFPMSSMGLNAAKQSAEPAKMPIQGALPSASFVPQSGAVQSPFLNVDAATLEAQWITKKEELKFVEQTEVLQADHQGPAWRNGMIAKKKSLILEIDALRKQIAVAKEAEASKNGIASGQSLGLPSVAAPVTVPSHTFAPQFQAPITPTLYPNFGVPFTIPTSAYSSLMVSQGYAGPQGYSTEEPQFGRDGQFFVSVENAANGNRFPKALNQGTAGPRSPGSATRRSHAVPIKKPQDEARKPATKSSTLDPKSPTYEPVTKVSENSENVKETIPPTPSPAKQSPWRSNEAGSALSNKHEDQAISQKPSLSSIDTTDFFPTNTHEHSTTRIAPSKLSKQSSRENTVAPTTPDKPWPAGPWNPPSDGPLSRVGLALQNDSSRRLTSWPEAFGKQSSEPINIKKTVGESALSSALARKSSSGLQSSSNINWPPIASRPVSYVPSTYQEGYQAGLCHMGLPNNIEVLNGFVDGIIAHLKEMGVKESRDRNGSWFLTNHNDASSARSSLQGYLSGMTLRDSAASLAENIRSAKASTVFSNGHKISGFGPKGDDLDAPIAYTLCNEAAPQPQPRKSPGSGTQSKADNSRADLMQPSSAYPRHFSGNQLGNRGQGTPVSMQRFYPSPKEYTSGLSHADKASNKPVTRQRLSGLDGAMDDLAGLVVDTTLDEKSPSNSNEAEASCFKSTSSKGKQKAPASPTSGNGNEASSPTRAAGSPKKSGEHSPAKARLEHVTNKLRRPRKDDPRTMSPEEKQERTEKWRKRFRGIKNREKEAIEQYMRENPRKDCGDDARR